jgi:PAS domain S-box-containing protein
MTTDSNPFDQQLLMLTLLNHVEDAIYFKDRDSRFRLVNEALVRVVGGNSVAAVLGRTDADFFGAVHSQEALATEQQIIRTGRPILNMEEKEDFPDGRTSWHSTSKYPLFNAEGVVIGTYGISRDITARKQTEAKMALLQSELLNTERRLAVDDFAELVLFHTNNMAEISGRSIERVNAAMGNGHFTQIKALADQLLGLLPPASPATDPCISLVGEIESEAEQQQQIRQDLLALKKQLLGIIQLVKARKHVPVPSH